MHPESLVALGWLVYLLGFLFWVFLLWLIIRQAVAAALRQQVVQQNDLILRQLAEQTKLLGSIERQLAPRAVAGGDAVDDLPPPPAARTSRP